jgi:hypothetical protein
LTVLPEAPAIGSGVTAYATICRVKWRLYN